MTIFLVAALRPLVALVVFVPLMALGLWLVRRYMPDGRVKRLLLLRVGK